MIKKTVYKIYLLISAVLIIALSCAIAWGMNYGAAKLPIRQYFDRTYTNAIWDWSNPQNHTARDLREIADFTYLHQITAIYLDVSRYEDFTGTHSEDEQRIFEQALQSYIQAMQERNVKVYAAAGHTDWSSPEQQHIPLDILKLVWDYNDQHQHAAFAGIQFDIESYNQKGFAEGSTTTKALVLEDFLNMADTLATAKESYTQTHDTPFELGFAVPYWFDNENGNIPSVTWGNKTGPALYHLLDRLNRSPDNNIVVMAYRNAARGNDGVVAHSRTEVEYAQTLAPNVHIIIGQETTDVEPAKITYYNKNTTELSSEVKLINQAFQDITQFRGIAINDLSGFMAMASK